MDDAQFAELVGWIADQGLAARMMGFASLNPSYETERRIFRSRSQSTATATMPGKMK
jgi:hypothetical protein